MTSLLLTSTGISIILSTGLRLMVSKDYALNPKPFCLQGFWADVTDWGGGTLRDRWFIGFRRFRVTA